MSRARPSAALLAAAALLALVPLSCNAAATDKELLLAFKESFSNGAAKLPSWSADTEPCPANGSSSSWAGIACSADLRVTQM